MDDMEKEAYVADLIDRWSYKSTRRTELPRFPDLTGRSTFKDGDAAPEMVHIIDPASYKVGGSGVRNAWNKAFVEALYEKVNGEWVLRDPFVAGAYLLRLSHKSGQNPLSPKPLTYEKAVQWVQQYNEYIKESTSQSESNNEGEKLHIIPAEEQPVSLNEASQVPPTEVQVPPGGGLVPPSGDQNPPSGDQIPPNSDSGGEQIRRYGKSNLNDLLNSEKEDVREILDDYLHIISDGGKSDYLRDAGKRIILKKGNVTEFLNKLKGKGIEIRNPRGLFAKPVDKTVYENDSGIKTYAEHVKAAEGLFNNLKNKFSGDFITNSNLKKHTSPESMLDQYLKHGDFAEAYDAIESKLGAGWHEKSGEGFDDWKAYYQQMWTLANLLENRMKQGEISYPVKTTDERDMSFRFKNPRNKDIEESGTEKFMPPTLNERPEFIPTTPEALEEWAGNIVDAYKFRYDPDKYSDKKRIANINRLVDLYLPSLREFLLDDNRNTAKERYGKLFDDWEVWDRFGKLPLGESGLREDLINWEGLQQSASIRSKVKAIRDDIAAENKRKEDEERKTLEGIVRGNLRRYLVGLTNAVDDEQNPNTNINDLVKHILSAYEIGDKGQLTYKIPGQSKSLSVNLSTKDMDFEGSKKSKTRSMINQLIKSAMYNELKRNMVEGTNVPSFAGVQLIPYLEMIEGAFGKDQNGVKVPVNSNIYNLLRETIVPRASTRKSRNPERVKVKEEGRGVKEKEGSETPEAVQSPPPVTNAEVNLPQALRDALNGKSKKFKEELFKNMEKYPEKWERVYDEIDKRTGSEELLAALINPIFDAIQWAMDERNKK
jgi:hypothetical protein